ncbi:hypothetical protein OSG_eHP25_00115 [environmental Halophage eHP-25]|nr:hypothetical protein OSG_eHP25_00115 [environmental Halophage eHP-25]
MKRDGLWVREMERFIQKQDTANQESPDVEIRYKTRTDTIRDTVTVAVPSSLSEDPIVSDRTPLNITENVVEHTYWDPLDRRFETRKYNIPEDNFSVGLYGSVRVQSEGLQVPIGADRIYFGPSLEVEYNRFSTSLSVYTTPLLSDQYVELMLRYEIF